MTEWELQPSIDITPTAFAVNQSATYAVVTGPTLADPEMFSVYIIELAFSSRRGGIAKVSSVDSKLFLHRPGLNVLQVAWHPDSDGHIAILTSDATFRLYNLASLTVPEQVFELGPVGKGLGLGFSSELDLDLADGTAVTSGRRNDVRKVLHQHPVAFQFGQGHCWERFTVYFLLKSGEIVSLCPIAPFGCRYPSRLISLLYDDINTDYSQNGDKNTMAWLQRAFVMDSGSSIKADGEEPIDSSYNLHICVPHALDGHTPVLSPPLLLRTSDDDEGRSLKWQHPGEAEAFLSWKINDFCVVMVTASMKGPIAIHVLVGAAKPRWSALSPQCLLDEGREKICAVRYQCYNADYSSSANQSLLLMDVIQLPEVFRDASEYNMRLKDSFDNSFNNVEAMGATHGSYQVFLELDNSSSEVLYCTHPNRSYVISIPYLPIVAEYFQYVLGNNNEVQDDFPEVLPSPIVEELYSRPHHGIVSTASVGDSLCGSGLLVLGDDNKGEFVRLPNSISSLVSSPLDGIEVGTDSAKSDFTPEKVPYSPSTDAHIRKIYEEIISGPKSPQMNNTSPGESISSEHILTDAITKLQQSHIEFAHMAHHDLMRRLTWLKEEVERQDKRSLHLADLVNKAEERGKSLQSRMLRGLWMSENIETRVQLLAELHWALPRPLSKSERVFEREELPEIERILKDLKNGVNAARMRVQDFKSHMSQDENGSKLKSATIKSAETSVSMQQLRRIRLALIEHDYAIRDARDTLGGLQSALRETL